MTRGPREDSSEGKLSFQGKSRGGVKGRPEKSQEACARRPGHWG